MLSPLSWWNDLFFNFPIAYAFGWVVNLIYPGTLIAANGGGLLDLQCPRLYFDPVRCRGYGVYRPTPQPQKRPAYQPRHFYPLYDRRCCPAPIPYP